MTKQKIENRFLDVSIISVFVLIFIIISLVTINNIEEDEKESISKTLITIRNTSQKNFQLWKKQKITDISYIVRNNQFLEYAKELLLLKREKNYLVNHPIQNKIRTFFKPYLEETGYIGVFIFTKDSLSLTSMRDANIGTKNLMFDKRGEILKKVFEGQIKIIPPIESDVPLPGVKGNLIKRYPTMFVAAPIKIDNEVKAVFTLRVDMNKEFSDIAKISRLGTTGETYAVDKDGFLISESRFPDQLIKSGFYGEKDIGMTSFKIVDPGIDLTKPNNLELVDFNNQKLTLMAKSVTQGETGVNVSGYNDYRGIKVIGAWVWDKELNIGIATELDIDEAFHSYEILQQKLIILICIILIASTLTSYLLVRLRKRSMLQLEQSALELEAKVRERTTELAESNDSLQRSEKRFRKLTDYSNSLLTVIKENGIITYESSISKKMLGYEDSERRGSDFLSNIHPEDVGEVSKVLNELICENRSVGKLEFRYRHKNNNWLVLNCYIQNLLSDKTINGLMLNISDVTDTKNKELIQKTIYSVTQSIFNIPNIKDLISDVFENLSELLAIENFYFSKYEEQNQLIEILTCKNKEKIGEKFGIKNTLEKKVIESRIPLLINDGKIQKYINDGILNDSENQTKLWLGIPIIVKNKVWGLIVSKESTDEQKITETEKMILEYAADQIGIGIEKIINKEEVEKSEKNLREINKNLSDEIEVRKVAEAALYESEVRLKEAQKIANIGNWSHDVKTNEMYCSDEVFRIFGLEPHSIRPTIEKFIDFVHPDDMEVVIQNSFFTENIDEDFTIIYRIIRTDGDIRTVKRHSQNVFDENHQVIKSFGTIQDITELVETEKILEESQRRLKLAVDSANAGTFYWDLKLDELQWDQRVIEIFDLDINTFDGKFSSWKNFIHKDDQKYFSDKINSVLVSKRPLNIDYRIISNKNNLKHVACNGFVITDANDQPIAISGLFFDISQRKRDEQLLEEAKQIAEKANKAKSDFLARMSHELRTPLNGILGYAQILKREKGLSREQNKGLNIIESSGKHLLDLINDILDLAKIEAQKFELSIQEFDLISLIQSVTSLIQIKTNTKGISFEYYAKNKLPKAVKGDARAIKQILLNLLGNAVKFTEKGFVSLHISYEGDNIIFEIKDTGIGISKENIKSIFDPFKQTGEKAKAIEGTGLGLSITEKLIKLMNGKITVESELGKGSSFAVEVKLPEIDQISDLTDFHQNEISGYEGSRKKVLIVDDNLNNRLLIESILKPIGFDLFLAENGQEAVELVNKEKLDLVLLDMVMPVMDGYEATKIIREKFTSEELPIIAISASVLSQDIQLISKSGCNDFISKPFLMSVFFNKLQKVLNVNWIYSEDANLVEKIDKDMEIQFPDTNILDKLVLSAEVGDFSSINSILEKLEENEEYNSFTEVIYKFVQTYDEDSIIDFINKNK